MARIPILGAGDKISRAHLPDALPGDLLPVAAGATWTGAVTALVSWLPSTRRVTLTGNTTLTLPTPPSNVSGTITLVVKQDATGGRTLKVVGARTSYGVAPALTGTANAVDIVHLLWDGEAWTCLVGATNTSVPTGWVS